MPTVKRPRDRRRWSVVDLRNQWRWAIFTSASLPLALAALSALLIGSAWLGLTVGLAFTGVMTMTNLRRVRRRNLSVTAIGLQVQRDRCALVTRWQDVTGVNRRRHQLLLPVEELRLSDSELPEPSSTGKPMRLPASLPGDRATRRIHIRPLRQELAHGTDRRPTSQPGITSV